MANPMANPMERYCCDVILALQADYPPPDFPWEATPDLGPTRMRCKDLLLQANVPEWRLFHDGRENRATIMPTLLVRYHAVSAHDDGEGYWNAQGLVGGISSWLNWRRLGQSQAMSSNVRVEPHYERGAQGTAMWMGWLIGWEDEIILPARFEYHFPDRVDSVGPEPSGDLSDEIDSQYIEVDIEIEVEADPEPPGRYDLPDGITPHDVANADYAGFIAGSIE